jgi:hypothetical protein
VDVDEPGRDRAAYVLLGESYVIDGSRTREDTDDRVVDEVLRVGNGAGEVIRIGDKPASARPEELVRRLTPAAHPHLPVIALT